MSKKPKTVEKPIQEWIKVDTIDVKYNSFILSEFLELAKQRVPENTPLEDISFEIDVEEEPTYYDDYIITVNMNIYVRSEEWKQKHTGL